MCLLNSKVVTREEEEETKNVIKFIWWIESKTTVSLNNFYYTFII